MPLVCLSAWLLGCLRWPTCLFFNVFFSVVASWSFCPPSSRPSTTCIMTTCLVHNVFIQTITKHRHKKEGGGRRPPLYLLYVCLFVVFVVCAFVFVRSSLYVCSIFCFLCYFVFLVWAGPKRVFCIFSIFFCNLYRSRKLVFY